MSRLIKVSGLEGKDARGNKIIVAKCINPFTGSNGYGVWALCENYSAGRLVKSWRYKTTGQTKDEAVESFNKYNRAI
jgi:hypothetical protein